MKNANSFSIDLENVELVHECSSNHFVLIIILIGVIIGAPNPGDFVFDGVGLTDIWSRFNAFLLTQAARSLFVFTVFDFFSFLLYVGFVGPGSLD